MNPVIDIDTLLTWGAAYKQIKAGELIFQEGSYSNFYHQLVSGRVRWVNIGEDGREFLQMIVDPGECFGEIALFDDVPFAASAFAETDAVILRLHRSSFMQMLKENAELHFVITKVLAQRLRFKFLVFREMATHDPEHHIYALLNYFKNNETIVCPSCTKVLLTRQQIADMTGMRVETVIRSIRNLHHKGKLHIEKGKIFIHYDPNHTSLQDGRVILPG